MGAGRQEKSMVSLQKRSKNRFALAPSTHDILLALKCEVSPLKENVVSASIHPFDKLGVFLKRRIKIKLKSWR